jgi:pyruvate kinase
VKPLHDFKNDQTQLSSSRQQLKYQLIDLYNEIVKKVNEMNAQFTTIQKEPMSGQNISAYIALEKLRTKELDQALMLEGLSSFNDIHPHVLFSLKKMINNIHYPNTNETFDNMDPEDAKSIKERRSRGLFGVRSDGNSPTVMVTLDCSMLDNPAVFMDLLRSGMGIARINCAHDHPIVWNQMVEQVRFAEKIIIQEDPSYTFPCKIYMDLAGPKIRIGRFRPEYNTLKVMKGDILRINVDPTFLGHPKTEFEPVAISITSPKALKNVTIGDRAYLDDGKVFGEVCTREENYIEIKIIDTQTEIVKLKEGKGVNLPDSLVYLNVPSLTEDDVRILPILCELADIIGLSFVHHPRDLIKLRDHLKLLTDKKIGVVAKIETKASVFHLTKIMMEGLNFASFGVMIARGDLAVEIGYTELTHVQESILRLCQASHIPVIWATGVLDRLAKKGIPTRTELTDAYMGLRADCIMLNKGPFISEAVKMIQNIAASVNTDLYNRFAKNKLAIIQYGY